MSREKLSMKNHAMPCRLHQNEILIVHNPIRIEITTHTAPSYLIDGKNWTQRRIQGLPAP